MTPTQKRGLPKPGQGARMIVAGDVHSPQITCRIYFVGADGLLGVRPLEPAGAKELTAGLKVTLEYFLGDALYRLATHIRKLGMGADANAVLLAPPEAVRKLQHRRFPRLGIPLSAQVVAIEVPTGFDQDDEIRHQSIRRWTKQVAKHGAPALTEAISASGLRLVCSQPLAEGATVFVCLALGRDNINAVGLMTWVGSSRTAGFATAYGIEFVAMDEDERKRIADFVRARTAQK